jgi:SAM-dependent methyltransferase
MATLDDTDPQQRLKSLDLLKHMITTYDLSKVDATVSPRETMLGENYFWVGASAMEVITAAVHASRLTDVMTILDLPCGHGRVLRHLAAMFPEARIDACDLDEDGVRFCAETFGANPIVSQEDLTAVKFPRKYDLIWIGSLFTHTSQEITEKWLRFLAGQLTDSGIIVATFHGRFAPKLHYHTPYIDDAKWALIMDGYVRNGYGYADYDRSQSHDFIKGSYGLSVAKPSSLVEMVSRIPGIRVHLYKERGWADNHDVIAFGPPDWDDSEWPSQEPKRLPLNKKLSERLRLAAQAIFRA